MSKRIVLLVGLACGVAGVSEIVVAQDAAVAPPQAPAIPPKPPEKFKGMDLLVAQWNLVYGTTTEFQEGLQTLKNMDVGRQWADAGGRRWWNSLIYDAAEKLYNARRFEDCTRAIEAWLPMVDTDLPSIEKFECLRVQAYLKAGKPQQALAAAKTYYNVCSMAKTSDAIDLICMCLTEDSANPNALTDARRFRVQQVKGASATTEPTEKSPLAEIKVDGSVYQPAIKKFDVEAPSYARLMSKGNLLLLADQPKAANDAFRKAYALAPDAQLGEATEGVARAMRAMDGTVGRANAWILSLRPEAAPK